jgi:hypothetical protein
MWLSATSRRGKAGRLATAVRTRAFERRRDVCQKRACERKQTACRSGRLLPDGVAVRCAPAGGRARKELRFVNSKF